MHKDIIEVCHAARAVLRGISDKNGVVVVHVFHKGRETSFRWVDKATLQSDLKTMAAAPRKPIHEKD